MTQTDMQARSLPRGLWAVLGLLALEMLALSVSYKHAIDFTCLANWPHRVCSGASGLMVSAFTTLGALAILAMLARRAFADLLAEARPALLPLALNLAGLAAMSVPILFLREGSGTASLAPTLAFWALGLGLGGLGTARMLAPPERWRHFLRATGWTLGAVVVAGLAAPGLAIRLRPLWRFDTVTDTTFALVSRGMDLLGYEVDADPAAKIIGRGNFHIDIAPVCSGIEGMALVTLFVLLYLALFRHELRFPRALILLPVGILVSAALNVVRIVALLAIGLSGHPDLAVGGFHSHAGWLMFTCIALGLIALAQGLPALRRDPEPVAPARPMTDRPAPDRPSLPPLHRDPAAARILPFAVFMLTALVASTVSQHPGMFYPIRALILGAAVALFWPIYARLDWRADPVAIGAGLLIGAVWVLIPVAPAESPPYGALTGTALMLWYLLRGVGTVLLVPLVEELFFRDYLEGKLRIGQGRAWSVFAALVSAGAFAALHDRWAEALAAGLVLSWICRRRGRVGDAILAHAVANATVYAAALASGRLEII
ncbi:exosortase E/protease, VPEID-CTERM system [Rhodovulum visakhapatnamense]|uniref:Exosortase E/protease, VPEID-CTERM system n=1 Tax=Rhodovulum visakhapatnamense TaxID=364297 RepID=A0ABS1RAV4_9RHOB|nr:exosortase E/protease, VPEID-CTERM system [Rhodovulum visakhapatnamense]MBL3568892.1 exosortase E/protease, VPEID-CTERM system [Rhodovulum visakhapatnamense]MBL3576771.1 exosortase E/protease, VPEID-CTERM system [Rhodovulum visakhapatnamense]